MCKLSLNIVSNVYNTLQSSFLSLAWPWPGRSLPKGNQWECWDPGTGTQCGQTPSPHATPIHPWHPLHPLMTLIPPNSPWCPQLPLGAPNAPYATYTPSGPWVPTFPASPKYTLTPPDAPTPPNSPNTPRSLPMPLMPPIPLLAPEYLHFLPAPIHPWHPYTLWCPLMAPTPLEAPNDPLCHLYPFWHLITYTPCQSPNAPPDTLHPLTTPNATWMAPDTPYTPRIPQCHLMQPKPLLLLSTYTPYQPPNTPLTLPTPCDCPLMPLTHPTPLGTSWCHLCLCWPLSTYMPCQPPNPCLTPPTPPNSPQIPHDNPQHPLHSNEPPMPPISLLAPESIHSLPGPQCIPCQPLDTPYTPAIGGI